MKFFERNMNVLYAALAYIIIEALGALLVIPVILNGVELDSAYELFYLESLIVLFSVLIVIRMYRSSRKGKTRSEMFFYVLFLGGLIYSIEGGISVYSGTMHQLPDTQIGGAVAVAVGFALMMIANILSKDTRRAGKAFWILFFVLFSMGFLESVFELTNISSDFINKASDILSAIGGLYISIFILLFLLHYEIRESFGVSVRSE